MSDFDWVKLFHLVVYFTDNWILDLHTHTCVFVCFYLQYESSVGVAYAWVYFVVVILVGSVFILNLLVGVLTK